MTTEQTELLKEKCAYCDEPMYTVIRAHHHTEIINGKTQDVTKHL